MKYEKINLPERKDAFKKKLDSLFDIINAGIALAYISGIPSQAHSGLAELEALGYKSMKELLYYSNKSILTLESVIANDIKLVNDNIKEVSTNITDNYVWHFNMDVTTIQTPTVCLENMKKYLVQKVVNYYSISFSYREADEKALLKIININLIGYTFDFAYDKQKNHLVLIALTEDQWNDIERDSYNSCRHIMDS